MTIILSNADIEELLDRPATVTAIEDIFRDTALGRALVPAPASLQLPGRTGRFLAMVAVAEEPRLASVKLLADVPDNAAADLPTQRSVIVLVDAEDGSCRAILAGRVVTRERTAIATAVASRHLARPESRVLGLVGAGPLAVAHVHSHLAVLPIEQVLVWSRTSETRERFRAATADLPVEVVMVNEPADAFAADLVCTLTPSRTPLIEGRWFRPGQHINAVGAPPRADHRELDDDAVRIATVFVDSLETALAKSGDVRIPLDAGVIIVSDISNELGDVIAGKITGRAGPDQITLFNSVGLGSQDLAMGALLLDRAERSGRGLQVDLAR